MFIINIKSISACQLFKNNHRCREFTWWFKKKKKKKWGYYTYENYTLSKVKCGLTSGEIKWRCCEKCIKLFFKTFGEKNNIAEKNSNHNRKIEKVHTLSIIAFRDLTPLFTFRGCNSASFLKRFSIDINFFRIIIHSRVI